MAEVAPFNGIRYDQSVVGDLSKVVSPPYDIISREDRVYYHQSHPNNFVRLILGEEFDGDDASNNRFTRAKQYLGEWLEEGILKQDKQPAIYVYRQQFEQDGKVKTIRGFTCAVKVHEYCDGVILPHENTLAKPKSQLAVLIRETGANLDSIYCLYADRGRVLDGVMEKAIEGDPVADTRDRDGVGHVLWMVTDPQEIGTVVNYLRDKPIAIADGHHRYETALGYRNEMRRKRGRQGGELPSDYTIMTIVNVHEDDMSIFPTHRVLDGLHADVVEGLEESLKELFEIKQSSKETIMADMRRLNAIGMYRKGSAKTLKLKGDAGPALKGCEAGRKLELNILHTLVLERSLGIDEDKLRNQTHISYTRDPREAVRLVDSGGQQMAFLLNHIDVKSVLEIASAGEKMPQKATYFYPKLLSGLVLRKMD